MASKMLRCPGGGEPMNYATIEQNAPAAFADGLFFKEMLVGLALLQMLLFGLHPSVGIMQIPVEITLFMGLAYALRQTSFDSAEVVLIGLCLTVTAMSFFTTPFEVFLVNAKQNILASMSLLAFTRIRFRSSLILPTLTVTLILLIFSRLEFSIVVPLANYAAFPLFNHSRFGGIFLSAHFNAIFIAVALIYYQRRFHLLGSDLAGIYLSASKFIFLSYVAQLVFSKIPPAFLKRFGWLLWLGFAAALVLFFANSAAIIDLFNSDFLRSGRIILMQLVDPNYYAPLLNTLPSGYIEITPSEHTNISQTARELSAWHNGHNEVGFFSLATQSGVFLAALFLFMLIRQAKHYAVLILVSLLHNVLILSPLIIYMMVSYSAQIETMQPNQARSVSA